MREAISVLIPFYQGNKYMGKLIESIENSNSSTKANITTIIFVNDSPRVEISIPKNPLINVIVIVNEVNIGIHASRVKGLRACKTALFIFLDQDDELIKDGFSEQVRLIENADIIVGNCLYQHGSQFKPIYRNKSFLYNIKCNRG